MGRLSCFRQEQSQGELALPRYCVAEAVQTINYMFSVIPTSFTIVGFGDKEKRAQLTDLADCRWSFVIPSCLLDLSAACSVVNWPKLERTRLPISQTKCLLHAIS